MQTNELITSLKSQSTWKLLGLGLITYGIYFAYYARSQSLIMNRHLTGSSVISTSFTTTLLILSYVSLALFIPYLLVDDGHPIELISNIVDLSCNILLIVWGFKARNRVNMICGFRSDQPEWFNGFWTFLFTPLYFNYKVNTLSEKIAE